MAKSEKPPGRKRLPLLYSGVPAAVKAIRKEKKLLQKEVAGKVEGLSVSELSKIETGKRSPGRDKLPKLIRGLGITELDLWREVKRQETLYYEGSADEIAEPESLYDQDSASPWMIGLMDLDLDRLPPQPQLFMHHMRRSLMVLDAQLEILSKALLKAYDWADSESGSVSAEGAPKGKTPTEE